jgi:hypothetical protein
VWKCAYKLIVHYEIECYPVFLIYLEEFFYTKCRDRQIKSAKINLSKYFMCNF